MNEQEEEIGLKELILKLLEWYHFIISKWRVIIYAGLIGSTIGLGYSFYKKTTYTANLTFALEEKSTGNGIGSIASQFGLSVGSAEGGAFAGDNLIELLKSRFIIEKTLLSKVIIDKKEDLLINRYIHFNKIDKSWKENEVLKNLEFNSNNRKEFTLQHDSLLGVFTNQINKGLLSINKIDKKLSIIRVTFISQDELFAKLFVENLVRNVTDFYIETKTSKSRANVAQLELRVDSVRKELDAAMYGRAFLTDQNMGLVRQSAAVPKIKQEMRVQMLSAMYNELIKNLEFSKLALMREEPLIQVIDYPILPLEKKRLSKLKGVLFGGLFLGFISVFFIILKKIITDTLNQ